MNLLRRLALTSAILCSTVMIDGPAAGAVIVTFRQSGPDVQATVTGTLNLSGDHFRTGVVPVLRPSTALISTNQASLIVYTGFTGPQSFGSGDLSFPSAGSGDFFFSGEAGWVGVSSTYVSGSELSAFATFSAATFASLGLTRGSYVYTTPADTITVNIGDVIAAVPEPSTWAMMLVGFGAIGYSMRRRRQTASVRFQVA